jgi:hypothetical protein
MCCEKSNVFQNRAFYYKIPHICVACCVYLIISRFKCFVKSKFPITPVFVQKRRIFAVYRDYWDFLIFSVLKNPIYWKSPISY